MCTRMSMDIRVHAQPVRNQLKISRRDSWSNHAPWLDHDHEINCSNALNFMTSTDAIAAKERICFDHELVRDQTNAFFDRYYHEIQALGSLFDLNLSWA